MGKLKNDFPGFAALEAAGEATHAKVQRRIDDGTLTEIPGIGKGTANQIEQAMQDEDNGAGKDDEEQDEKNPRQAADKGPGAKSGAGGPLVNDGTVSDAAAEAGQREERKSGIEKNEELENHALDQPPKGAAEDPASPRSESIADRLAYSGAVFYDLPEGPFVSKEAQPQLSGRVKTLPIAHVCPRAGMEVHDGDTVYALDQSFDRSTTPNDWLRVRNPDTGELLVGPTRTPESQARGAGRKAERHEALRENLKTPELQQQTRPSRPIL